MTEENKFDFSAAMNDGQEEPAVRPGSPEDLIVKLVNGMQEMEQNILAKFSYIDQDLKALDCRQEQLEKYMGFILTLVKDNPEFIQFLRGAVASAGSGQKDAGQETK